MVVCMNRVFVRLLRKANIDDDTINAAIREVVQGNRVPLGHGLFKKRIASSYQGKRGAYRSILYYRSGRLMVFIYLFAKNDRENITPKEMNELVQIARAYDSLNGQSIEMAISQERLRRWKYETNQ